MIIFIFFVLRLFFAIVPPALPYADEMWQGPEIAHNDIFGYGWLTWEWTRNNPLRSPLYHSLFSFLFWLLKTFNIDYAIFIAYGPRILQCFLSSIYDYYLIKLLKLEGIRNQNYIVIVNFTLWFSLTCFSKTLINTFETILFTLALYNWIKYLQEQKNINNILCRLFVIINVIARQSAIIPWIFIWPHFLLTFKTDLYGKFKIILENFITLMILLITSITIDSIYHGKLTSTFFNFLEFNLLSGMSSFYGVHDKLWFITQGLPYVQLGWIVSFIIGVYAYIKKGIYSSQPMRLLYYLIFTILILSLSAHKEDRFLLPLFPIIIFFICMGIQQLDRFNWKKTKLFCIIIAIITNLTFFIFMNTFQDVGALKTMSILRERNATSVEFFTQCHRTPFYSFIHKNIPMNFPDCSPTTDVTQLETYQLHKDPLFYIDNKLKSKQNYLPSHLVIYDYLINKQVEDILKQYKKIATIYHQYITDTYFEDQYNVHIIVYELIK